MSISRAVALGGLTAAVAAPSLGRSADLPTLRIGAAPTDATAQHLYAQDLGMFTAADLQADISPMRSSGALLAGLIGGSLDLICTTIVQIAQAHNKGIDLRAIAAGSIYDGPPPQAVIARSPHLDSSQRSRP